MTSKLKFNYQKMEYELDDLLDMASRGSKWAIRELKANGWLDTLDADAGNEPQIRN